MVGSTIELTDTGAEAVRTALDYSCTVTINIAGVAGDPVIISKPADGMKSMSAGR
jgi:hypothetical protein